MTVETDNKMLIEIICVLWKDSGNCTDYFFMTGIFSVFLNVLVFGNTCSVC